MSREDLVELAALDVFGLLDEYESALFTRSFHHASASVQDEVLQLQAEIAGNPVLAPEVTPPSELRQRVLVAVSRAVELENTRLAPIASIGGHRVGAGDATAGARTSSRWRKSLFNGSGSFWRAAAFVLCGAVVVLAYFQEARDRQYERIMELFVSGATQEQLAQMVGMDDANLVYYHSHPRRELRELRPATATAPGMGLVMYVDPVDPDDEASAFVFTLALDTGRYTVEIVDNDGDVEQKFDLASNGTVGAFHLGKMSTKLLATATFRVVNAAGETVLST